MHKMMFKARFCADLFVLNMRFICWLVQIHCYMENIFKFLKFCLFNTDDCVCVYSNSRNNVPPVAQQYGAIAAHTQRHTSAAIVFVVFCVYMHSFVGLIRQMPQPTFSDTPL